MKIDIQDKEISFIFPRYQEIYDPFDDSNHGEYPSFTGLIIRHRKGGNDWDEIGFAATIDMSYKGKPDQVGDFMVMWHGEEDEFIEKCKEMNIGIEELEV